VNILALNPGSGALRYKLPAMPPGGGASGEGRQIAREVAGLLGAGSSP
jgi:hypothetical protein